MEMGNLPQGALPSTCDLIFVNYNGKEFLERCLSSLLNMEYDKDFFNVILVDNGSIDGSVDFVKEYFPWVKLIANKENLGFAGGMNAGLKHATGKYVLIMNLDTEVHPSFLKEMVETADSDPTIGIVTCKVLHLDEKNIIDTVGGANVDIYGFPSLIGGGEVDHGQYDYVTEVFASGHYLARREVLEKIGGFDAKLFLSTDDIDIGWRAQLLGYRVVVNPFAIIYHKISGLLLKDKKQTDINVRSRIRYLAERSTLRMLLKNYSSYTLLKILPRYFMLLFLEFSLFLSMGKFKLALSDVKAVLWNIKNLLDTYRLHKQIQRMRVVDDHTIQRKMIKKSLKISNFRRFYNAFKKVS
ncbi:rhamnosyltransferase [Candidatus Hakubella thermalkaliphila]|uniref:Rhamnosyltransferase n=2 Tax=Candidatus Hakubella thermalkaliphila TaxID=2754717 RepID=A0A6V8NH23_9ACTN|nr:glycosyltransferase family 2 protein [Candidatus Hakubella thermalkaliphila]MBT9167987.1 Poly-beta-1,6-N-acetyl-D-glucosamine synthase [Bacillota bacterium]GFP19357.1 rhamnosyltransferase [Candidatus Hakubella thermalkaliphila]GFP39980.1 rhamnosyltransferase [Candidatus Hakubella thermalkaliphila]GFP42590.1 rhamnosyltransferase [Candidatus Hakubella thermalkaliphila]